MTPGSVYFLTCRDQWPGKKTVCLTEINERKRQKVKKKPGVKKVSAVMNLINILVPRRLFIPALQ
jgi:hypothetical protein